MNTTSSIYLRFPDFKDEPTEFVVLIDPVKETQYMIDDYITFRRLCKYMTQNNITGWNIHFLVLDSSHHYVTEVTAPFDPSKEMVEYKGKEYQPFMYSAAVFK